MPIIGFKNKFKNFKPLDEEYLVKFDMEYTNHGALVNKDDGIQYDMNTIEEVIKEILK